MSQTPKPKPTPVAPVKRPRWTQDELLRVAHLGPAIIGREMYEAAQQVSMTTKGGTLGPALLAKDADELATMKGR